MALAKCFLIVFNSIFFLLGGACLGIGVWIYIDQSTILRLTSMVSGSLDDGVVVGLLQSACIALMAGGGFVFIIGFLGCCGAMKEIKILLYLYALFVGLILAGEIAAGVLGYVYQDRIESELRSFLQRTIDEKYESSFDLANNKITTSEVYSLAWEFVHWKFECCGINGSDNFMTATNWNRTATFNGFTVNLTAPVTCCKTTSQSELPTSIDAFQNITMCVMNTSDTRYSNAMTGCYDEVRNMINQYSYVVFGVGIGIAVVELLGIIAACCLIKAINKKDDEKDKKK